MNFELDDKYLAIQGRAREFARSIAHLAPEADSMSTVHTGILENLRESGLSRLMVPAAYGGEHEKLDPLAICLVREALMAQCCHADSLFAMQGIGSYTINIAGSVEQREHWLPKIASAECLPAFALTEPDAGSDLKRVTTEIATDGDGFCLNGDKSFISNAGAASYFIVFARDGSDYSMVLVSADAAGIRVVPTPEIIAPHVMGEVQFDNVRIPATARLGSKGDGMRLVLATLGVFRVSVAGAAVGLAQAALEEAVRHTRTREQFGRPMIRLGPVAQMLADCWTEIEMARLITYRAACMAGEDSVKSVNYSSMAKLGASEMASRVVDRCVQVMGRFGLVVGTKMERLYRQARPMRIYEGASEVLRLGIAKELADRVP
ncbi:MAG: acyl-CoA dehydrogenase family protein [Kiritimatiellia bacterium]|jgi:acyl-CoA dehydrogenase|nr:acyl-CoA dehydrogenase family protein [Pseudomonadales bacterium]MDP7024044.1 acyl-CoA dehydrogenase family protein [Kiritimatiellia bacterium]|tara:strand:+ start:6485 stop:7615 length:1131 start_codon:yes stop_codon:yes gene_type:complete